MDEIAVKIERVRKRKARSQSRQTRKAGKPRCEVISCGKKGPHACTRVAARGYAIDGHRVCILHAREERHVAVFTASDAISLYRRRHEDEKLWMTQQ